MNQYISEFIIKNYRISVDKTLVKKYTTLV